MGAYKQLHSEELRKLRSPPLLLESLFTLITVTKQLYVAESSFTHLVGEIHPVLWIHFFYCTVYCIFIYYILL